jgi:hypothetical protein
LHYDNAQGHTLDGGIVSYRPSADGTRLPASTHRRRSLPARPIFISGMQ